MLRVNPRVTFLSKIGYIFIKFGSKWLRRHDSKRRSSCVSSLIRPSNRLIQTIFKAFPMFFQTISIENVQVFNPEDLQKTHK